MRYGFLLLIFPAMLAGQTIEGDVTVQKWAEICQTEAA